MIFTPSGDRIDLTINCGLTVSSPPGLSFRVEQSEIEESTHYRICTAEIRCEDPSASLGMTTLLEIWSCPTNRNSHSSNESGEPNGVTILAGLSGSNCPQGHPCKLKFEGEIRYEE